MELNTFTTILVAVAPAVSAALIIIGSAIKVCSVIKKIKKEYNNELMEANQKLVKAYNDIATIKAKITSIENQMKEEKK